VKDAAADTKIVGILPARWDSSRFPGKPLHPLHGKPLLQHTWERCLGCKRLDDLLVATDDERIRTTAEAFGARVVLTSASHPTGTDRIAEAVAADTDATHVINIQGDEPLIEPGLIDELAETIASDPLLDMVTAANPLEPDAPSLADPNVVKVVVSLDGRALYFSRSPIPFFRNPVPGLPVLRHKGIYAYRRDFLEHFVNWPPSPLEQAESLEQLRALENGASIHVVQTEDTSIGLDAPDQIPAIEALLSSSTHNRAQRDGGAS
jgi:3-deoxy-manno-octulosonate cytidylyltransferase (CMP-KDO synthetase)